MERIANFVGHETMFGLTAGEVLNQFEKKFQGPKCRETGAVGKSEFEKKKRKKKDRLEKR